MQSKPPVQNRTESVEDFRDGCGKAGLNPSSNMGWRKQEITNGMLQFRGSPWKSLCFTWNITGG